MKLEKEKEFIKGKREIKIMSFLFPFVPPPLAPLLLEVQLVVPFY